MQFYGKRRNSTTLSCYSKTIYRNTAYKKIGVGGGALNAIHRICVFEVVKIKTKESIWIHTQWIVENEGPCLYVALSSIIIYIIIQTISTYPNLLYIIKGNFYDLIIYNYTDNVNIPVSTVHYRKQINESINGMVSVCKSISKK